MVPKTPDPLDPTRVHDRATFLKFVRALAADYRLYAPHGLMAGHPDPSPASPYSGLWITFDLGEFLETGVAWVEHLGSTDTDFPGTEANFPAEPSWAAFAAFLFMAKTYYPGRDV